MLSSAVCCSNLYENARPSWTLLLDFPSELPQTGFHLIPCFHMAKLYPSFSLFSHQPSPSIVKKTHNLFPGVDVVNISKRRSVQNTFLPQSMSIFCNFSRRRIVSYWYVRGCSYMTSSLLGGIQIPPSPLSSRHLSATPPPQWANLGGEAT